MSDHDQNEQALYRPKHSPRFITAAALFDGHDAAINIMRRLLQMQGAEVIHLGHNRSVEEVVRAALAEDVQGVAISSYQGGHMEYFKYLVDRLREEHREDVLIFGGGGGVIVPREIKELEDYGVKKIFSPQDGQRLGLKKMINQLIEACDYDQTELPVPSLEGALVGDHSTLARLITFIQAGKLDKEQIAEIQAAANNSTSVVIGITGTGGSGKSSLTDELIRRVRLDQQDKLKVAVLAIDPSKKKGGGALLGDRIRMNSIESPSVYFRSIATRGSSSEIPSFVPLAIDLLKAASFDLVIVETPGIGQGDAAVTEIADISLYVMTPEFGAPSQLEKIDMIDFADVIAINKFDRSGAKDAYKMVAKQWSRSHFDEGYSDEPPVFGTIASRFNDDGTTALYQYLLERAVVKGLQASDSILPKVTTRQSTGERSILPAPRARYLAEITETIRLYHRETEKDAKNLRKLQQVSGAIAQLRHNGVTQTDDLDALAGELAKNITEESKGILLKYRELEHNLSYRDQAHVLDQEWTERYMHKSLSGTLFPKVALPKFHDDGDLYTWLRKENLPGHFPYTAGVFPFKRQDEDPTRMFAGEGDPERTNRRFHLLADGQPATRLSTAFDSVTLYGRDPDTPPDIYGKIGTSGVSVATLDDMKTLYRGFDLCDPKTSVSMTINGPAPTVLAMYFNTAIDQQVDRFTNTNGRTPTEKEYAEIKERTLRSVRGTVQADILKEDQGQNTCIFSTEFSLSVMSDIQQYFIDHEIRRYYSVSISGYHIAEAGANPITQLAFTLANAFTYVEAYLARGMKVDDFAPNLSFFFSNGMDPEYTVIGRVARRIWAVAMRERYHANERSQRLKYHIQTSGRSLHAQEMAFNDIRTTLQALCAIYDNANSLHTNAYDEAVTTPTTESVRRALAIQLIINKEWGLAKCENPNQGSFIVEELTDLVEEAVLAELDRLAERGGVLGAMETGYQRSKIQDDSMVYEQAKHDGSLPIVGVNTFINDDTEDTTSTSIELARATEEEKSGQIRRLREFNEHHSFDRDEALKRLRDAVLSGSNVFEELIETVKHASLGAITQTLFEVGGVYRRNI
jgi:methylmalonyl-CoA mutase